MVSFVRGLLHKTLTKWKKKDLRIVHKWRHNLRVSGSIILWRKYWVLITRKHDDGVSDMVKIAWHHLWTIPYKILVPIFCDRKAFSLRIIFRKLLFLQSRYFHFRPATIFLLLFKNLRFPFFIFFATFFPRLNLYGIWLKFACWLQMIIFPIVSKA